MAFTTIVSAAELGRHLDDPCWVVFDCRHNLADAEAGRNVYLESHIPGARFLHLDRDLSSPMTGANGRHPLPDPNDFARRLGATGVGPDTQVVAYDSAAGMIAGRLWWMLRWIGHDAVAVLDGGLNAWRRLRLPETGEVPVATPRDLPVRLRDCQVGTDHVHAHLGDPAVLLLDARSAERFRGIGETLDPVGGHIPGAINRFFGANLDADGCLKPAGQLRMEFDALLGGARPDRVVHQCGSGVSACLNMIAMEVAGLPGSRLYPGSWSEWCSDRSRPMET